MLRYSIYTLLIILIVTIVLTYSYNEEAFTGITTAAAMSGAAGAEKAGATGVVAPVVGGLAAAAPSKNQVPLSSYDVGTVTTSIPSRSFKETNTNNAIAKRDKVIVKREYSGTFLRIFASMPSLTDNESLHFSLIGVNPIDSSSQLIWTPIYVTNDSTFLSAEIPENKYMPYIGQTVYLVSRKMQSPEDADATFTVPIPPNKNVPSKPVVVNPEPAVVNPEVTLSDTGYDAMKLNKQSNLLNDIQKIVHNEILMHRATDVSVKNPAKKKRTNRNASNASNRDALNASNRDALNASNRNTSNRSASNASCAQDEMGVLDEMGEDEMGDEIETQDMSKYIKKDEIPCWGCSLDY
jgi:hypothetical protein